MPTTNAVTPLFRGSVGPLAKGVQGSVDVRIDGHDISYIRITASKNPDALDEHELRINEATGAAIDIVSTSPVAIELTDLPIHGPHMIRTVWLTSGSIATTFDVEGVL